MLILHQTHASAYAARMLYVFFISMPSVVKELLSDGAPLPPVNHACPPCLARSPSTCVAHARLIITCRHMCRAVLTLDSQCTNLPCPHVSLPHALPTHTHTITFRSAMARLW